MAEASLISRIGRQSPPSSRCRAFTLVELIVTIGIVGLLLGILLPALRGARVSAELTRVLANQRAAHQTLTQYMHDHQSSFPFYGTPGTHEAVLEWDGRRIDDRYWSQPRYWGLYLHTLGYDGWLSLGPEAHARSYEEIRDDECAGCGTGYMSMHMLTNVVYAAPAFWTENAPPDKSHHRAARGTEIAHPSAKAVLLLRAFADPRNPKARTLAHFADGHGEEIRFIDMRPGVRRGVIDFDGFPGFSTERGVLGVDR